MKFFNKSAGGSGSGGSGGPGGGKLPTTFDYKDPLTLYGFLEGGKIIPGRVTGLSHSQQRTLCKAIKTARSLGLLPSSHQTFDDFGRPESVSPKPFKL